MRCKSCNRPFRPTLKVRHGKLIFSSVCSTCVAEAQHALNYSRDYILGAETEYLGHQITRDGSIRTESY